MSGGHHARRWELLRFAVAVGGDCARSTVEFARALDCYRAGRDAEAWKLFVAVAAARPADPEPVGYLRRLIARGFPVVPTAERGRGARRSAAAVVVTSGLAEPRGVTAA